MQCSRQVIYHAPIKIHITQKYKKSQHKSFTFDMIYSFFIHQWFLWFNVVKDWNGDSPCPLAWYTPIRAARCHSRNTVYCLETIILCSYKATKGPAAIFKEFESQSINKYLSRSPSYLVDCIHCSITKSFYWCKPLFSSPEYCGLLCSPIVRVFVFCTTFIRRKD